MIKVPLVLGILLDEKLLLVLSFWLKGFIDCLGGLPVTCKGTSPNVNKNLKL